MGKHRDSKRLESCPRSSGMRGQDKAPSLHACGPSLYLTTLLPLETQDPPGKSFSQPKPKPSSCRHSPLALVLKSQHLPGNVYLGQHCRARATERNEFSDYVIQATSQTVLDVGKRSDPGIVPTPKNFGGARPKSCSSSRGKSSAKVPLELCPRLSNWMASINGQSREEQAGVCKGHESG